MENGWNLFSNGYSGGGGGGGCGSRGGQNDSTCANVAWDIWELGTTSLHQVNASTGVLSGTATTNTDATTTEAACHTRIEASEVHALMFPHNKENTGDASLYAGGRSYYHPDPHLMCLKLGKRHYFEDATPTVDRHAGAAGFKRGKPYLYSGIGGDGGGGGLVVGQSSSEVVTVAVPATVPRCQVEGCHVVLVNAKEYHRRHKVCEMHSKAPKVVVLGLEQRFCQQCSRFHAVSEFDESKRSCRRRLAGHNERRRKSSHLDHPFPTRNPSQENKTMADRFRYISPTGRALSLLSSNNESWITSPELSSRCSAALRELIAENRASIMARQLILDRDWHYNTIDDVNGRQNDTNFFVPHEQYRTFPEPHGWDRIHEASTNVTLDLMQAPTSAFGFLSMREKSKEEEECSELWRSIGGTHVV